MVGGLKTLIAIGALAFTAGTAEAKTVISQTFDAPGTGSYTTVDGYAYGAGIDATSFPTGSALYFRGNNQGRSVTFAPVDLSPGGTIDFSFILGKYGTTNQTYFEGADGGPEDVTFAYSTNGGLNWTNFDTYSTSGTGTRDINGWTKLSYTLAPGAALSSTTFRFLQPTNSGSSYDHWAIDNFFVSNSVAVPEPATWAMMIAGIGMVGFAMRRRQRKATTTVPYAA